MWSVRPAYYLIYHCESLCSLSRSLMCMLPKISNLDYSFSALDLCCLDLFKKGVKTLRYLLVGWHSVLLQVIPAQKLTFLDFRSYNFFHPCLQTGSSLKDLKLKHVCLNLESSSEKWAWSQMTNLKAFVLRPFGAPHDFAFLANILGYLVKLKRLEIRHIELGHTSQSYRHWLFCQGTDIWKLLHLSHPRQVPCRINSQAGKARLPCIEHGQTNQAS